MVWMYKGTPFTEKMIGDNYGFVYCITNILNGKMYIGRKYFYSKRTLPPLKGKTRKRHVVKSSGWENYWSSSKILLAEVENLGKKNFTREILSLHPDKRETNYAELAEQVIRNVLDATFVDGVRMYYNENIMTKFYPSQKYGNSREGEHIERMQRFVEVSTTTPWDKTNQEIELSLQENNHT